MHHVATLQAYIPSPLVCLPHQWHHPNHELCHPLLNGLQAYIPRWFAYHINVTTYLQFSAEQNTEYANKMLLGSAWYCTIVASTAYFSPLFAVAYMYGALPALSANAP
jgi:hypothetical protein